MGFETDPETTHVESAGDEKAEADHGALNEREVVFNQESLALGEDATDVTLKTWIVVAVSSCCICMIQSSANPSKRRPCHRQYSFPPPE